MTIELFPAVAYLRMSSDQQDGSIEQQRTALQDYAAKNGYSIIREYIEAGKSGLKARKQFELMVSDSQKRDFEAVLTWDVARFARLDPISAASYKDTLRKNGVHLSTVKQGRQDWDSTIGQVIDTIHQGQAHEYSRSLSKDSIRGRLSRLEEGCWPNGCVPYGYDRKFIDTTGGEHLVSRRSNFTKGKGWRLYLSKNEIESKVVRRIFDEFLSLDISMRGIAANLNSDKVVRPDGSPIQGWTNAAVKATLVNKVYAGFAGIGGINGRRREKTPLNRMESREKAGAVPEIVTLAEWTKVQEKLKRRKVEGTAPQLNRSSVLSGVLVCGHCGYRLSKHERTEITGKRPVYFTCDSAIKRPGMGCKQWRVLEEDILPTVLDQLVRQIDRTLLLAKEAKPEDPTTDQLANLQARLSTLDNDLKRGQERYLKAPDHLLASLESTLSEWKIEQDKLKTELDNLTRTSGELTAFAHWWESIRGNLIEIPETELTIEREVTGKGSRALNPGESYRSDNEGMIGPDGVSKEWLVFRDADGREIEREHQYHPPLEIETDKLRCILKELGCRVVLFWKPKVVTRKGATYTSKRNYELDRARLEAGFFDNSGNAVNATPARRMST